MAGPLQHLLEVEARARAQVDDANRQRQRMIDEALAAAHDARERFDAGRATLRAPFLDEAHARAQQVIAELERKYAERRRTLRELAAQHEPEAVAAAFGLLLDPAA